MYNYININYQHNAYLESIKISIIGRNWGNAKKHNEQILEHNRLKPNSDHSRSYGLIAGCHPVDGDWALTATIIKIKCKIVQYILI